jgi:hypothetical protein
MAGCTLWWAHCFCACLSVSVLSAHVRLHNVRWLTLGGWWQMRCGCCGAGVNAFRGCEVCVCVFVGVWCRPVCISANDVTNVHPKSAFFSSHSNTLFGTIVQSLQLLFERLCLLADHVSLDVLCRT